MQGPGKCPKCKTHCSEKDFYSEPIVYNLPFGKGEVRQVVCITCVMEHSRKAPKYTKQLSWRRFS